MSLLLPFQFLFLMMSHPVTYITPPQKKNGSFCFVLVCFFLFCFLFSFCFLFVFFCFVFLGRHLMFQHFSVTRLFEQRITHVELS